MFRVDEAKEIDMDAGRGNYGTVKPPQSKKMIQASPSVFLPTGPSKPIFKNMECQDLLCRVRTEMKLPIDERPELMKFYMHKRMALQAQSSLNTRNVEETVGKEFRKQRIAQLRLHH